MTKIKSNRTCDKQKSESRKLTAEKRATQICRVIDCKIDSSHFNKKTKEQISMLFIEAKRCINYVLSEIDNTENTSKNIIADFSDKDLKDIYYLDKGVTKTEYKTRFLSAAQRQDLLESLQANQRGLNVKYKNKTLITKSKKPNKPKKNSRGKGRLQYRKEVNVIGLKQIGATHKIASNLTRVKIQGVKQHLRINGLKEQLKSFGCNYEFGVAKLTHEADGYHLHLNVYFNINEFKTKKSEKDIKIKQDKIGIDFGCQTTLTLSTGEKINIVVKESERLKGLQRKLKRQIKSSNNYRKTCLMIRKEYLKLTNKKDDIARKIVKDLLDNYLLIIFQDEQISKWKTSGHGRAVQHSILGRVKALLKQHTDRICVLDKYIPTTKFCSVCGKNHNDIKLFDRQFVCPNSCISLDRDIHAAQNMIEIYNLVNKYKNVAERNITHVDFESAVSKEFETCTFESLLS